MINSALNDKLVQFFNETLAMEHAAEDRIQTRISETPLDQVRQQLQYHLEETRQQQGRLTELITNMGGSPTNAKASLPIVKPATMDTVSSVVEDTAKSIVSEEGRQMLDAEKELIRTKEDAIIENAEIVSYKMLMELTDKAGLKDASAKLKQSLQEEAAMANFITGNTPVLLSLLWPKIEAAAGGRQHKIAQA
jgi:ferritin-like metal-binding protein YciE